MRQELQQHLRDGFSDYWRCLQTFLSAKLSKREFDNYIKQNLAGKIALHNSFVLALLSQAFSHTPPPDILNQRPAKSRDRKKPKTKLSASLPIKSHLRATSGIRNPKTMWLGKESRVPLLVSPSGSPETREIAQRMMAIAEEEGLERVEDSAVQYLQQALRAHLVRLVKAAPPVVYRSAAAAAEPSSVRGGAGNKRAREEASAEIAHVITMVSLRIAADKNGQALLCDDLPLHRERLLLIHE